MGATINSTASNRRTMKEVHALFIADGWKQTSNEEHGSREKDLSEEKEVW